jgi:hypothetical protein
MCSRILKPMRTSFLNDRLWPGWVSSTIQAHHIPLVQMGRSWGGHPCLLGLGAHHIISSPTASPKPSCSAAKRAYMTREVPVTCDSATISLTPTVNDIPAQSHISLIISNLDYSFDMSKVCDSVVTVCCTRQESSWLRGSQKFWDIGLA